MLLNPLAGVLIHEHLWDRRTESLSVRRGRRSHEEQIEAKTHEQFTQVRAARMRKTLLLLCGLY